MYIKLGKTNISYKTQETLNKYTIIGQIINSPTSFENPVLVNSRKELDIWFSKDFLDRDYFIELLKNDVTLFLYKPISTKSVNMKEDVEYIDYSSFDNLNINGGKVDDNMILLFYLMKLTEAGGIYRYKVLNLDKTSYDFYIWINGGWVMYSGTDKTCVNEDISFDEKDLDDIAKILSGDNFKIPVVDNPSDFWIWLDNRFVVTSQLPQNLENFSESLNNRDTLTITNSNLIQYTHPEFTKMDKIGVYSDTVVDLSYKMDEESNPIPVNLERINEGKDTLVFHITNTYTAEKYSYSGLYFVIINPVDNTSHLYYCGELGSIPQEIRDYCVSKAQLFSGEVTPKRFLLSLRDKFRELNYTVVEISDDEFRAYSEYSVKVTYFNNIPGLVYEPDTKLSYNIISKKIIEGDNNVIEFWSKTIGGTDSDENRISINIEKVELEEDNETDIDTDPYYRVTISKYDYTETFEGPTRPVDDSAEERLDYVISKNSKLVYCSIQKPGHNIKEGDYMLRGGINEKKQLEWEGESWRKALSILFDDQNDPVYPDFFLIPNINKFCREIDIKEYYNIYYKTLLNYATEFNCQFLIQNNDSNITSDNCLLHYELYDETTEEGEKKKKTGVINVSNLVDALDSYKKEYPLALDSNTYYLVESYLTDEMFYYINDKIITQDELDSTQEGVKYSLLTKADNDYIFNYTKDTDNRLVYFYRYMYVNGEYRPGYYVFLQGILTNVYSISIDTIIYNDPVSDTEDVYSDTKSKLLLDSYKSNYLINNNLVYFYKNFQNGVNPKPRTTILFRFIAGKIQRELLKNKWKFLGEKNMSKVQEQVEDILKKIRETYKIVKSLNLTKFLPDMLSNKLDLEMDVRLDDLVDKDITLNVTVDYSDLTD